MSIKKFLNDVKENNFVLPSYTKNSFIQIPSTITKHFGLNNKYSSLPDIDSELAGADNIILFLIDGLGVNIWKKYAVRYPLFKRLEKENKVQYLNTLFPSTTSVALTTLQYGTPPKTHGMLEWHLYLSKLDLIIESIPYRAVINNAQDANESLPQKPSLLFGKNTVYQKLKQRGVKSFVFTPKQYLDSFYQKNTTVDAKSIPYTSLEDLATSLRHMLENVKDRTYSYVYMPHLDILEHKFGPYSKQANTQIKLFEHMLRIEIIKKMKSKTKKKTALLIASDHGHITCDPKSIIYLNSIPTLFNSFERSKNNNPILPRGNVRDVFLSIKQEKLEETYNDLTKRLSGIAGVYRLTKELTDLLFGENTPHPDFNSRLGNILILPFDNNLVWYRYKNQKVFDKKGIHGGLSADEMNVPFAAVKVDNVS